MKVVLAALVLSGVLRSAAFLRPKQGDKAPDFKAPASLAGKEFQLRVKMPEEGPGGRLLLPGGVSPAAATSRHTRFSENSGPNLPPRCGKSSGCHSTRSRR